MEGQNTDELVPLPGRCWCYATGADGLLLLVSRHRSDGRLLLVSRHGALLLVSRHGALLVYYRSDGRR